MPGRPKKDKSLTKNVDRLVRGDQVYLPWGDAKNENRITPRRMMANYAN